MKSLSRTSRAKMALMAGLILLLAALPVGSVSAAPQAETFTSVERSLVEFVVDEPCLGEQVYVSGYLQETLHVTIDPKGGFHVAYISSAASLTGTGLSSGETYLAVGTGIFSRNIILDRGQTVTGVDNSILIGPNGNNLYIRYRFHLTRNANDELTTVREVESVSCG